MFAQDGYGPPPPPRKTRKHVLPVAGWSGWPLWLRAGPPAGRPAGGQPVVVGWRAGCLAACFLQLSKHGRLGRKPLVCAQRAEPPVTTREQWPGRAGGGRVEGQPRLFSHSHQGQGQAAGRSAPPFPPRPPSCFPPCPPLSPTEGPRKTEASGNASGLLLGIHSLGGSRAGGGDWHHTGSSLPGAVASESQVCFPTSTQKTVSLPLGVFRPSAGPATGQAAELSCWLNKWKLKRTDTFHF